MAEAESETNPLDDVRDLAMRPTLGDAQSAERVYEALLGMGREGDFGRLGDGAAWLAEWQKRYPPRLENPTLAVFAGSHGISQNGVTLSSNESTREKVDALREGRAPLSAIAAQVETNIRVFELAIDKPTPNFAEEPAMSARECAATIAYGFEALEGEPDLVALGVIGAGIGTSAAALACALYGGSPEYWVRPGPQVPKEMNQQRVSIVSQALTTHRGHLTDPLEALRCLGGRELAACVGAIIAARHQGVPVLIDGFATTIAAGVVHALNPLGIDHVKAAHVTRRPAHEAALERIGMTPIANFEFNTGGGMGSAAAIGILRTACSPFIAQPSAQ
ncbi:MAG: nicotinate-nucleotide--dimethylbenzimidazole phosphoribosyltransferase [Hyphomonadaceae bacterium]|nr:nicotinate-nucleotide--dimethylbenzimidazole phosphoribosyltransferase [Hyphomonadaceae bacterium]